MHELSYCEAVVDAVERRAQGRRVAAVGVHIGALHRVVADAFDQSFQLVAAGGVADGAVTEVVITPVLASCDSCGQQTRSPAEPVACAGCGGFELSLSGGDEVLLAWLRYVDEPAATEPVDEAAAAHSHLGGG